MRRKRMKFNKWLEIILYKNKWINKQNKQIQQQQVASLDFRMYFFPFSSKSEVTVSLNDTDVLILFDFFYTKRIAMKFVKRKEERKYGKSIIPIQKIVFLSCFFISLKKTLTHTTYTNIRMVFIFYTFEKSKYTCKRSFSF